MTSDELRLALTLSVCYTILVGGKAPPGKAPMTTFRSPHPGEDLGNYAEAALAWSESADYEATVALAGEAREAAAIGGFRWRKWDGEWIAVSDSAAATVGDKVVITKANGDSAEHEVVGKFGPGYLVRKVFAKTVTTGGVEAEAGEVYLTADGKYVKVTKARAGHLYAKVFDRGWQCAPGALGLLDHKLTAEEAAAFGFKYERCVFCSLKLGDDGEGRSVEVGYGATCAKKHSLPWGVKAVAAAKAA